MQTSKSPKQTARVAYAAAQKVLPPYSHDCSPHMFTQPQWIKCGDESMNDEGDVPQQCLFLRYI
ncbi:MAG: hypothetical protein A3G57_03345 [Candidatus Andersenbacteria bacterium RIFCSPLOWO2_12_FULL_45_8]|nr:MAG: hypothetical protein A3I08_04635 [Candidatus Andersenbacteria bacterium RIFCSPLOWO2_02_FULL_46_11]OGY42574.1 MAG: hypothetical protein A3G57_03345 [Candidatus Andersenbacteria bacterium RIFCSPLOWO2_12_FULL_45_8]